MSTWNLLKDSLRLSLDGVPKNVDIEKIKATALKIEGIADINHIHVWALSTTQNALTAHLVISNQTSAEKLQQIKERFRHELEHQNIQHATLETETCDVKQQSSKC